MKMYKKYITVNVGLDKQIKCVCNVMSRLLEFISIDTMANLHGKWKDGMGKGARWQNAMPVNGCVLQTLSRF